MEGIYDWYDGIYDYTQSWLIEVHYFVDSMNPSAQSIRV